MLLEQQAVCMLAILQFYSPPCSERERTSTCIGQSDCGFSYSCEALSYTTLVLGVARMHTAVVLRKA